MARERRSQREVAHDTAVRHPVLFHSDLAWNILGIALSSYSNNNQILHSRHETISLASEGQPFAGTVQPFASTLCSTLRNTLCSALYIALRSRSART